MLSYDYLNCFIFRFAFAYATFLLFASDSLLDTNAGLHFTLCFSRFYFT